MQTVLQALGNNLFHIDRNGSSYARTNAPDNGNVANVNSFPGTTEWARAVAGFVVGSGIPKNHRITAASLQFDHAIVVDDTPINWFKADHGPEQSDAQTIYDGIGATYAAQITEPWDSGVAGPFALALTNVGLTLLEQAVQNSDTYFPLGCKVDNESLDREGSIFAAGLQLVVTHYPLA